MEQSQNARSLAAELEHQLRDKLCVVKLMRGQDHLGMARMEVKDVYVDDRIGDTTVFRVVGKHTGGSDHAMLGLPMNTPQEHLATVQDDDHVALKSGEFEMVIHPGDQHMDQAYFSPPSPS